MKERCPKCGSDETCGLIASFWVQLDEKDEPKGSWIDWESNTELTDTRSCQKCEHEW